MLTTSQNQILIPYFFLKCTPSSPPSDQHNLTVYRVHIYLWRTKEVKGTVLKMMVALTAVSKSALMSPLIEHICLLAR